MQNDQLVFVGVVMGWEYDSTLGHGTLFNHMPPVLTEFCAGGNTETGAIDPTPRMRELAAAGYRPIAVVRRDLSNFNAHYLFAHEGISAAAHMQLVEDANAIFEAAAGVA